MTAVLSPTDVAVTMRSLALYHRERAEMERDLRDEATSAHARTTHENRRRFHARAAALCERQA